VHYRKATLLIALSAIIAILSASRSVADDVQQVRVDPSITWTVNGYSDVQRIFGATVNGELRDQMGDEVRSMKLNGARAYLWPYMWWTAPAGYASPPQTPWAAAQYGGKAPTREEAFAAWDKFFAQDFDTGMDLWWNAAHPGNNMTYQLDLFRKWGVSDGIILHTQVDGSADRHPDDVYRYYHAYLNTIERHYPDLHFEFVQVTNEPNYPWWSGQFSTTKESVDTWLRVFNNLDARIAASEPETQLLGPCLASSEFFSWGGWSNWTAPILSGVHRPMHYYNYHLYDTPAYTNLAWMEMLQARAEALGRPRPQGVITEMQYRLYDGSEGAWKERCRWWAEHFFTALANPDKEHQYDNFLLGSNPSTDSNVFVATKHVFHTTDLYWLYWAMANTRGKALYVAPSDGGVRRFACSPEPGKIVVSLFNSDDQAATVAVDPGLATGANVNAVTQRIVEYQGAALSHDERTLPAVPAPVTVTLEPGGVTCIEWSVARGATQPSRTLGVHEYFSRMVAVPFDKDTTVQIAVPSTPSATQAATLRFAVNTDDLLSARGVTVAFNGHTLPVVWNQAPRQTNAPTDTRSTWWMELPLKRDWVRSSNEVTFSNVDSAYRLMFASLASRDYPDAPSAERAQSDALRERLGGVFASVKPIGPLLEHSSKPLDIQVTNQLDGPKRYTIDIAMPTGAILNGCKLHQRVLIAGHAKWFAVGSVEAGKVDQVEDRTISVMITPENGATQTIGSPMTLLPRREAMHASSAAIDWDKIAPVVYQKGGLTAKSRLSWDERNLYVAVDVSGKFRPQQPDSVSNFYAKDAIELFVDPGNNKRIQFGDGDTQLFLCPIGVDGGAAFGGTVPRKRQGDAVNITGVVLDPAIHVQSTVSDAGYTIQAAIPWRLISAAFRPTPGCTIGFDLAIDHFKGTDGVNVSDSIFGLPEKSYMMPCKWGIVRLLADGSSVAASVPIVRGEAPSAPKAIVFSPKSVTGWSFPTAAPLDAFGLHLNNVNGGSNLLLRAPIPPPLSDGGVSTTITIGGFEKTPGGSSATGFRTHLRAYWSPKLPNGFIDPWSLSDCFWLMGSASDDGLALSLFRKTGEGAGNGTMLWSGTISPAQYPLTVHVWLGRDDYRIMSDTDIVTTTGSRSGKHGLPLDLWSAPVQFGIKSCYGTQSADLIVSGVTIQAGK